jgi:hypothetical protein
MYRIEGRAKILVVLAMILLVAIATPPETAAQAVLSEDQEFDLAVGAVEVLKQKGDLSSESGSEEKSVENSISKKYPDNFSAAVFGVPQQHLATRSNGSNESHRGSMDVAEQENTKTISRKETSTIEAELGLSLGYRVDDLDWNIAGNINGNNPDILSELSWNDLEIFQTRGRAKVLLLERIYLRGTLGYGWILDGEVQDSDFSGNNRTFEFSRSNNSADNGNVLDASVGAGYQFSFALDSFDFGLIPLIGYSYHEQNLTLTDGFQTVSEPAIAPPGIIPPPVGPFPGLDSTYETEWNGPWLGLDFIAKPSEKLTLSFTFEYHWADYYAEANWNLRTDFAHPTSFEHEADGEGYIISARWQYFFAQNWAVNLDFDYQDWSTDSGTDRTFLANGTTIETRLNEVNWTSYDLMLGIAYRF